MNSSMGSKVSEETVFMYSIASRTAVMAAIGLMAVVGCQPKNEYAAPPPPQVVQVQVDRSFPNCPRYLHRMQMVEHSTFAPRPDYTPPVPAWKTYEAFRDSLPPRDRSGEGPT